MTEHINDQDQRDIELLWIAGCPNLTATRSLLHELVAEFAPRSRVREVDATDPVVARQVRFPGSPTIRVDGHDVQPDLQETGDHAPRCRVYRTERGLFGVPPREWIVAALGRARPNP